MTTANWNRISEITEQFETVARERGRKLDDDSDARWYVEQNAGLAEEEYILFAGHLGGPAACFIALSTGDESFYYGTCEGIAPDAKVELIGFDTVEDLVEKVLPYDLEEDEDEDEDDIY